MAALPVATQPLPPAPAPGAPDDAVNLQRLAAAQPSLAAPPFANSGPSLNPYLPPWHRPNGLPPDAAWPGRAVDFALPLRVQPIPSEATEWQQHINAYLDAVAAAYPTGLVVVRREISERSATSRAQNVQTTSFRPPQGGPVRPYVLASTTYDAVANGPAGAVWPPMLLSDYAGLIRDVYTGHRRGENRLALLTSQVVNAPNAWHQTVVLVLDYTDHPLDGKFRAIYVYDPQHVGPNHPRAPGVAPWMLRLHDTTGSHLVILRHLFKDFLSDRGWGMTTASDVVAGQLSDAWIGGGGSGGPVAQCRRMACTWLQQTAGLVVAERVAVDAHRAAATPATLQQLRRARDERRFWLQHFVPLVR